MSTGMRELQDALPAWVRMERHSGDPMTTVSQVGDVTVVEVNAFPEAPADAVHGTFADTPVARADVHFTEITPTAEFPDREELIEAVQGALGQGEFAEMSADDLAGGPSYITLGGWLGSQDLALMLIGAVDLAGIAKAITPAVLGLTGDVANEMAAGGFVMLGPSTCWGES